MIALIAAGKFPDSPMPRSARAMQKPTTEKTKACDVDDSAQIPIATA